jgi:hypothetical protein
MLWVFGDKFSCFVSSSSDRSFFGLVSKNGEPGISELANKKQQGETKYISSSSSNSIRK